jgi:hypothetical protein
MNKVYFNFINNDRNGNKTNATALQYSLLVLLAAANIFMIVYCFNLFFYTGPATQSNAVLRATAVRQMESDSNHSTGSAVNSDVDLSADNTLADLSVGTTTADSAANSSADTTAAGLNTTLDSLIPAKAELDLSAFDSPSLAALKSAFINFDTAYLKRFSADLNEINLKSAFSPFAVLKTVEAAFQNYIFINSFSISRTAPLKASVKISGFTPSNNYFITFSDYLSRAGDIEGFTFETKENPGTRTRGNASTPEDRGGINFGVTFDYTVKMNNKVNK